MKSFKLVMFVIFVFATLAAYVFFLWLALQDPGIAGSSGSTPKETLFLAIAYLPGLILINYFFYWLFIKK